MHMTNLDGPWRIVRKRAGLDDVRRDSEFNGRSKCVGMGEPFRYSLILARPRPNVRINPGATLSPYRQRMAGV